VLTRWIDQGAKFDGADREEALAKLAPATPPANPPAATPANPPPTTPMPAPPPGEPAFSTHVAPVLAAKCINCHGGRQPRNRLSMESFANLMRGGMTGRAITPGNGAGSLLIQKLKGTAKDGQRMPLDADPLPAAEIAAIEKWIAAGAKFDGPDPARPLAEVIALGAARGATHEELSRQRSAAAAKNWKLAIPDDASRSTTTDNFLVIGNVPQERLDAVATEAERLAPAIRTALGLPADKPLVRGRLTLYALAHRHDYTEFALMIEGRSKLPRGQVGHWRYTVADAYAAFVAPDEKPGATPAYGLPALLAEQIAAATVAARWQTPQWLANGIGKYLAATTAPADPRVAAWDERLKQLLADKPTAEDWLGGKLPHDDEIILGYGLARQMMSGGGAKMRSLAAALERQQPLDEALKKAYGRALAELAANWLGGAAPAKKGKK
jgi:hypothetical protein